MRKKIFLIIMAIFLLSFQNVKADPEGKFEAIEKTDGASEQDVHYACGDADGVGCGYVSERFIIRVTLIDKTMTIVDGTRTVEFEPLNPYHDGDNYRVKQTDKTDSEAGVLTWNRTKYNFQGTMRAKDSNGQQAFRNLDTVSDQGYKIYLGFGKDEEVDDDFSDYAKNRRSFMNFLTSLEKGIYVQDIGKNVDFVSFFLKVSGYTDTLTSNKGTWTATEIYDITRKIGYDNEYYLFIEPVYYYNVVARVNGKPTMYEAEGTPQQLAQFYTESARTSDKISPGARALHDLFWPARTSEVIYNHLCNFIDLSETYDLITNNGELSHSYENVEKNMKYCNGGIEAINELSDWEAEHLLGYASYTNSGFGRNLVDLSELFKTIPTPEPTSCKLEVNSCAKDTTDGKTQAIDNFILETKLSFTDGNLSDCIYPGEKATSGELGQYIYHIGEGDNQLWCYDDITYDFSYVQRELKNKTFSKNQLVEIPNGKLTVVRKCYTKTKDTPYLTNVFNIENDPGKYQQKFTFEFNNKKLEFVRNNNKKQLKYGNDNYKVARDCKDRANTDCTYLYTGTLYYEYELSNGTKAAELNIGIKDLQLYNTVPNTNSIDFMNKYTNSKIIKISSDTQEGKYINRLDTQIKDGYGLTNDIYNKIKSSATTPTSGMIMDKDTKDTMTYYRTTDGTNHNKVSDLLYLDLEENKKDSCNVTTYASGIDYSQNVQFRVISLSNPFPARDGTTRLPGENWINRSENNAYYYIQNNRNVNGEEVYNKEPLYKIKLDAKAMIKIREYNKTHSYSDNDITCESGTGRMCISSFLRNTTYISNLEGTCKTINAKEITALNKEILEFEATGCNEVQGCMEYRAQTVKKLDLNKDGYVRSDDLLKNTADFYTCADKSPKSGG